MLELIKIIDTVKAKLVAEYEVMEARKKRKARVIPKIKKQSFPGARTWLTIVMADLLAAFFLS